MDDKAAEDSLEGTAAPVSPPEQPQTRTENKNPWSEKTPTFSAWLSDWWAFWDRWVAPVWPDRTTIEISAVVIACVISIAQWFKIGDNSEDTRNSIAAIQKTAEATEKIANETKTGSAAMRTELEIVKRVAAANISVSYSPLDAGAVVMLISNTGMTEARDVQVFGSPEWYGEAPLGLVGFDPPPPFDIRSGGGVPYTFTFTDSFTADHKKIPALGPLRDGFKLRLWYSVHWFDVFGRFSVATGCYIWDARIWNVCAPPKAINWERVYKLNGVAPDDAKAQAELTRNILEERRRMFRERDIIK